MEFDNSNMKLWEVPIDIIIANNGAVSSKNGLHLKSLR